MIKQISQKLSNKWMKFGIIPGEDILVYSYGLELIISTVLNVVLSIIISLILSDPFAWLFFLLAFIPLRTTAGGYHAKTHFFCGVTFCVVFTMLIFLNRIISVGFIPIYIVASSIFSLVTNIGLSPVPAVNKPQTEGDRIRNRSKSLRISMLNIVVSIIGSLVPAYAIFYFASYSSGQLAAAVSLIVAKLCIRN